MFNQSRRAVLRRGAALGAGIAAGAVINPDNAEAQLNKTNPYSSKWDSEYTWGHTIPFMEEYYNGTMEMLGCLSGEIEQIGELSSRASTIIKEGGTVWSGINVGHMVGTELSENRRGNPGVIKDVKDYEALIPGDMVFTNHCNKAVQAARDRGVYVVAVPVNYVNNEFRPEGFTNPNEDNLLLADVSNEILHSHVPYFQGLVHAPEIPEITLFPSTTTGSGGIYWMLAAEITNKLHDRKAKKIDKSAEFLRTLTDRVKCTYKYLGRIREAAVVMAKRVKEGGTWFVKSPEHPGLASELHYVECGPMIVNLGDWDKAKDKNIMLINAISPAYPEEMKLALEKQVEGAYVIGVGPSSLDGVVPPGRLIDVADVGFDNFSPESGGVITVKGLDTTICPTSGIVGNVIQQMIGAQWTDEMIRRGVVPYFFKGVSRVAGREYINVMKPFFDERGY